MLTYYRTGDLDDCRSHVRRFRMCVMSRLRSQDESELIFQEEERKEKEKNPKAEPVWEFRPEYVVSIAEHNRLEREKRKAENAEADRQLEEWWKT